MLKNSRLKVTHPVNITRELINLPLSLVAGDQPDITGGRLLSVLRHILEEAYSYEKKFANAARAQRRAKINAIIALQTGGQSARQRNSGDEDVIEKKMQSLTIQVAPDPNEVAKRTKWRNIRRARKRRKIRFLHEKLFQHQSTLRKLDYVSALWLLVQARHTTKKMIVLCDVDGTDDRS